MENEISSKVLSSCRSSSLPHSPNAVHRFYYQKTSTTKYPYMKIHGEHSSSSCEIMGLLTFEENLKCLKQNREEKNNIEIFNAIEIKANK